MKAQPFPSYALLIAATFSILAIASPVHSLLTNSLDDGICETMAAEGKCETQPDIVEFCAKACNDVVQSQAYYESIEVDDDLSDEFFNLKAKNWTGVDVNFSEFDGYITAIANLGITCQPGEDEHISSKIDQLRRVLPYTVKLLIFPFGLDGIETTTDCNSMDKIIATNRKSLHVMDLVEMNGEGTHDVYKFLKKTFGMKEGALKEDRTTFFFVNPVATRINVLEGAPLSTLKKHIKNHLMGWEQDL